VRQGADEFILTNRREQKKIKFQDIYDNYMNEQKTFLNIYDRKKLRMHQLSCPFYTMDL